MLQPSMTHGGIGLSNNNNDPWFHQTRTSKGITRFLLLQISAILKNEFLEYLREK